MSQFQGYQNPAQAQSYPAPVHAPQYPQNGPAMGGYAPNMPPAQYQQSAQADPFAPPPPNAIAALRSATASGPRHPYLGQGEALCRIDSVHYVNGRKNQGFVVELTPIVVVSMGTDGSRIMVGTTHSIGFWQSQQGFDSRFKRFLVVACDMSEDRINEHFDASARGDTSPQNIVAGVLGPMQVLKGTVVHYRGVPKQSQRTQQTITQQDFIRIVSPTEVQSLLSEDQRRAFFPNGELDRMISEEQLAGNARQPAQVQVVHSSPAQHNPAPLPPQPAQSVPAPAPQPQQIPQQGGYAPQGGPPPAPQAAPFRLS